jgi:S-ribosylhomocysteine lyase LuxS involved in autoinducer biosynthesis
MKMSKIFLLLLMAVFILTGISYSQSQNSVAENMAVKLQQKVLLSKDQTIKVADILSNYFGNMNQISLEKAKKSIESILDKRQKAKYDIIKNDWWSTVQKAAVSKG